MGLTSREVKDSWCLVVFIMLLLVLLFITSCINAPTHYFEQVRILSGPHVGQVGILIGDCPGIEHYKVKVLAGDLICVNIFNMEAI